MEDSPEGEIRARIATQGRVTFSEFMEVALYHPRGGYYTRGVSTGTNRDYYTSPGAHPAFGALIAIQLFRMWEVLGRPYVFHAIEMGAGSGLLGRDVVEYAGVLPKAFRQALHYVALDRSPCHTPSDNRPVVLQRLADSEAPTEGVVGCFLSNELVDSFPVHRFQIHGGALKEVYVALQNDRFVELLDEPSTPLIDRRIGSLGLALAEGYRSEVNLEIGPWMRSAAHALGRGFILTIDYGYEAAELYAPYRTDGTLQTYRDQITGADPYRHIGTQDITAHVDFSAIIAEGEVVGVRPVGLCVQATLLSGLGLDRWLQRLRTEKLSQREGYANMMAMRELARPDGLGGFKVLVQEKSTGVTALSQLAPPCEVRQQIECLPVPLLRPDHVQLMEARYPHLAWDVDEPWPRNESQ